MGLDLNESGVCNIAKQKTMKSNARFSMKAILTKNNSTSFLVYLILNMNYLNGEYDGFEEIKIKSNIDEVIYSLTCISNNQINKILRPPFLLLKTYLYFNLNILLKIY